MGHAARDRTGQVTDTKQARTRYGDEGWTFGTLAGSQMWLTVWGSHWDAPVLHATREEAVAALEAWTSEYATRPPAGLFTVARVRMVFHGGVSSGRAFRILDQEDD